MERVTHLPHVDRGHLPVASENRRDEARNADGLGASDGPWSPSRSWRERSRCATGPKELAPPPAASGTPGRGATARQPSRTPTSSGRSWPPGPRTTTVHAGTPSSRPALACTASPAPTRARRFRPGNRTKVAGRRAADGLGQEPPRDARHRRQAAQHAGRRAHARPGAPVVRPAGATFGGPVGVVGGGEHDVQRSPSRPTTRPCCTWTTWARASGSSSSTSATTCRAPATPWPHARAWRRFVSASRRPPSEATAESRSRRAHRPRRLSQRHRRALGRLSGRVRHPVRLDRALSR